MAEERGWDMAFDDAVRALGSRDRRRLLVALLEHNPHDELHVPEVVDVGETEMETLHGAFYHRHLPLLDGLEVIEWDEEGHTVSKGPDFGEIRPLLELLDEHRDKLPDGWV